MSFLPINVDFSKHTNLPNKDYGVIDVHFGSDSPLLEVELNEAQILTRNLTKNLISNYFKDGLLEISSYSYGGGVLALVNATIFFQGNIIRVTNTNISAPNGSKIYLNVKESMKTFNDVLYPEGNLSKATDNNNYFIDSRIGSVTSNRTVLEFKITTQQESGFNHLLIGSISSNVFNVSNLIPNIYQLLHKGTYAGSASDLKNDIDTKLPTNEAYKNYVKSEMIGDTPTHVDYITTPGKYQCGANGGLYHLSYLDVIQLYPGHVRQIHHDFNNGIQWRDAYNSKFSNIPWNTFWDSLNSPKSHETENVAHKLFTSLGALNLKNWLVENYTSLMNNIRESLTNMINTKTPHGGYSGTSNDLKNLIDSKVPIRNFKSIINTNKWSCILGVNYAGSFKVIITYGRRDVVAKGVFLITLGHDNKATIVTLSTHNYAAANFNLRIRMENDKGILEMFDIANKVSVPSNELQDVYIDIFDTTGDLGFIAYSSFTSPNNTGIIACSVETRHGSMYYNQHRIWHTGEFNPDDKENTIGVKYSGFNKDKTDVEQNDSNKLFTALGALNLKNWLVTNYTTLMNNIRDTLNNSINTKLSHGGYNNTAQQLKNEIDTKFPSSEAWINYFKVSGDTSALVDKLISPGQYQCGANGGTYHLSYINVYEMYPGHIRQVREHWGSGSSWREIYRTGNPDFTNVGWNFYLDTKNINERYCPYRVGDILTTTIPSNPGEVWSGTGWEKIEGCFLYAHNSAGDRGGENTVYLNVSQLPPHNHGVSYLRHAGRDARWDIRPSTSASVDDADYFGSDTTGSGAGINNMPSYYTVHVWKRIA